MAQAPANDQHGFDTGEKEAGWNERPHERPPSVLQIHKTFSALSVPAYRFLWFSMLFSFLGMQMQVIARGVLAYEIGGTNSALAVVSLGWGVPMLLLSLVGGAIADRFDRRNLLIISQLLSAVIAVVTAVMVQSGMMTIFYLFLIGVIQGTIFSFNGPARNAYIPEVVGEDQMMNGIALNSAGMNLTRIVGPSIAGPLIAVSWVDIEGVFYIQAALTVIAFVFLLALPFFSTEKATDRAGGGTRPSRWRQEDEEGRSVAQSTFDGLRYVVASPILLTLLLMGLVPTLLGLSYQTFLPVFAKDIFGDGVHRNGGGLGLMMTMTGIGALVGSLVVASLQDFPRRTQLQLFGGLGFGASLAFFAVQNNFILSIAGLTLIGFSSNFFQALNSTIVMSASDPRYYGRVMSVNMLTFALMPLGTLPIGYLADVIGTIHVGSLELLGVQTSLMGAGLIIVAFILMMTVRNPAYRRLEQNDFKRFAVVTAERFDRNSGGSAWSQLRGARRDGANLDAPRLE